MTYPILKFAEVAEALREEYENAEVTSSDTSITVSRTIEDDGATYKYAIEFTPPDGDYEEEVVELYIEDLFDSLYGSEEEGYGDEEEEYDEEDAGESKAEE
jgi:hypothetical protein